MGRTTVACLAFALMCVVVRPASAQLEGEGNPRLFEGLFGGAAESSSTAQALDFTGALFGGYDDDIFARGTRSPRAEAARVSGAYAGYQAMLTYGRRYPRQSFGVSLATSGRYITSERELVPTYHAARVHYGRSLSPRTSFGTSHRVLYRPYYSLVPLAGGSSIGPSLDMGQVEADILPDAPEVGEGIPDDLTLASSRDVVSYSGNASLSRSLTDRSALSFGAGYILTDFGGDDDDVSNVRWRAFGCYTYRLTRYLSARLGYGYRTRRLQDGRIDGNHDIDVGVNYGQPFVLGRGRTTLAFTTGSTVQVRDRLDAENSGRDRVVVRLLGSAALRHDFVGPWQGVLAYQRSVGFLDGFSEPFVGDRVTANLGGLIGRRTDVMFTAGYLTGSFGLRSRDFDTLLGSLRLRTALTQNLALFAQYYYYQYEFDELLTDALLVAPQLERQGVRAGLTVWLPLLR